MFDSRWLILRFVLKESLQRFSQGCIAPICTVTALYYTNNRHATISMQASLRRFDSARIGYQGPLHKLAECLIGCSWYQKEPFVFSGIDRGEKQQYS